nr:MAG TPA: tail collar domain protein [Caudoviricetes sp.]
MAKTNYQIFNEENAPERTYNDSEYKEATQRVGGVMPGMALSRMHNKMYYQWSAMCKAIANLIVNRGRDCMDSDVEGITKALDETITSAASGASLNLLQRSRAYQVGDIAYHKSLPSWARLECVRAGTTGATLPTQIEQMVQNGGVMVTDGTVVWIIDDLRDGAPVGAVRGSLYLPAGYVKANGATVQRADYPRLVALADKHNLWTDDTAANAGLFGHGDGTTTMVLPNWTDRMVQMAMDSAGASVAAGLPNIHIKDAGLCAFGEGYAKKQKNGVIYTGKTGEDVALVGQGRSKQDIEIDVSTLNPIYGASATVQPAVIKLIPVIRY